jgi:hypothetical protein
MPEFYLHYLWFTKQIALFNLQTPHGDQLEIIDFGEYNASASGPDFTNVVLKYGELIWCGSVEMHINSSDWYNHNHHNDEAYNQVILHVVYNYNQIVCLPHGELLTLELKDQINHAHLIWFKNYYIKQNELPCSKLANDSHRNILLNEWEKSVVKRLKNKIHRFIQQDISPETMLYRLIARAFGGVTNQLPFDEMTERLSLDYILSLTSIERIQLICVTSGLREFQSVEIDWCFEQPLDGASAVLNSSWKRKGQRYFSHPVLRVKQFAVLMVFWEQIREVINSDSSNLIKEWKASIQNINEALLQNNCYPIAKSMQNHLLINAVIPFKYFIDDEDSKAAFQLLRALPSENNSIRRQWSRVNQISKNALHSQGSIEYFNDFCLNFKCMRCVLGKQLLYGGNTENNLFF